VQTLPRPDPPRYCTLGQNARLAAAIQMAVPPFDSAALTRQSFGNANGELHPRSGLKVV